MTWRHRSVRPGEATTGVSAVRFPIDPSSADVSTPTLAAIAAEPANDGGADASAE